MCGRYDLVVIGQALAARFGVAAEQAGQVAQGLGAWQPRYNIAPSQLSPVVVRGVTADDQEKRLALMKWGLVPGWAKEARTSFSTINARAETITQKPAFRKLLTGKRCLVPATGYFEWAASSGAGGKQPYRVQITGGNRGDNKDENRIMALAGLYDVWKGPYGERLLTYTIITTEASPRIRALHERMPVILSREDEQLWLDPGMNETERLLSLLRPYPDTQISAYRVGRGVNNPANDRAELIRIA